MAYLLSNWWYLLIAAAFAFMMFKGGGCCGVGHSSGNTGHSAGGGCCGGHSGSGHNHSGYDGNTGANGFNGFNGFGQGNGQIEMVLDPVCGMSIDPVIAISQEVNGKMYYFCSESCRDSFIYNQSKNR